MDLNYETDIVIDESSLDIEWLEQPRLMMEYSRHQSELEKEKDFMEEKLDLLESTLDHQIRSNPEKFGIDYKLTETVVGNHIKMNKEHKELKEALLDIRYEINTAKGAVKAFDARKSALENLVKLHGQQYFAGPNLPRDITEERNKIQKSPAARITRKRKK